MLSTIITAYNGEENTIRKILSIASILVSLAAFLLLIDGHFYNETILVYMFPIFMWKLRGGGSKKTEIKTILLALFIGIIGGIVSFAYFVNIKTEIINNVLLKVIIVGVGLAIIAKYVISFLKDRWGTLYPIKNISAILECMGGIVFVTSQSLQGEVPISSPAGGIIAFIVYGIKRNSIESDKWTSNIIKIFSILFACCMTFGNLINMTQMLNSTSLVKEVLSCVWGWYWIWNAFLVIAVEFVLKVKQAEVKQISLKKYFVICFFVIFTCFLPYFFAFYPGVLSKDSISQMSQIMGILPTSNHHPWIHTQLIKICYQIGIGLFGNVNAGVATYSVVSMIILAFSFATVCVWQYKVGLSFCIRVLSVLYLALCPFNGIYSVTMWKDIPFTAFSILFMLYILNINGKRSNVTKRDMLAFIILSILVCLFRSNGIFVWLFTVPFLIWMKKDTWRKWTFASMIVLVVIFFYKSVLLSSLGVVEPDLIESMSIPAQQISCVIAKGGKLSEEAKTELSKVVEIDKIGETYQSGTSDPIKRLVRETGNMEYISAHPLVFGKIYVETGLNNFYYYLEAFIEQTKGYWHHKENDWIYHTTFVSSNEIGIYRDGILNQFMIRVMENILSTCLKGFHIVWSLALFTYLILFAIMISLIQRKSIVVYMPLIGLLISLLIATPRYCDFRYVYLAFAALPLYMGYMVCCLKKSTDLY